MSVGGRGVSVGVAVGVGVGVFVGVAVGGIGVAVGGTGVAVIVDEGKSGTLIVGTGVVVGLALPQAAARLRMIIVAATIL